MSTTQDAIIDLYASLAAMAGPERLAQAAPLSAGARQLRLRQIDSKLSPAEAHEASGRVYRTVITLSPTERHQHISHLVEGLARSLQGEDGLRLLRDIADDAYQLCKPWQSDPVVGLETKLLADEIMRIAADGLIKNDVVEVPTEELPHRIKRRFLGGFVVKFNCPACRCELNAEQSDIGEIVTCPTCHASSIRVPGTRWLSSRHATEDAEQNNQYSIEPREPPHLNGPEAEQIFEIIIDGQHRVYDKRWDSISRPPECGPRFWLKWSIKKAARERYSLEFLEAVCQVLSEDQAVTFQVDRSMREAGYDVDLLTTDSIRIAIVMDNAILNEINLIGNFTLVSAWADRSSWADDDTRIPLLRHLLALMEGHLLALSDDEVDSDS